MERRLRDARGASAVEFALVLPVLIAIVLGIIEFGHAFQVQSTLSAAAREGARTMALQNNAGAARSAVKTAASVLDPGVTDAQIAVGTCPAVYNPLATTTVTVTYQMPFLTGFFGSGIGISGKGVMRCNG